MTSWSTAGEREEPAIGVVSGEGRKEGEPRMTFFAMLKPQRGHTGAIQRNAIQSWIRLRPRPEVILFGNEEGVPELAAEFDLIHEPLERRNKHGTLLMDEMFRRAHARASHSILVYINADILLFDDFTRAVQRAIEAGFEQFLMVGRRTDTDVGPLDFHSDWRAEVQRLVKQTGSLAPRVCKDYFVFRKPLYAEIPPFAVGRAVYDNWFVYHARELGIPVIDATRVVQAVHQNHDYGHIAGGRGHAYVKGIETKRNRQLAGGMRLVRGSTTSWIMTPTAIRPRRIPSDWVQFAVDLPRFLRLVAELYGGKWAAQRRAARYARSPQT